MMVAFSSLFSSLVVERFGQRIGLCFLFALIVAAVLCVVYERLVSSSFLILTYLSWKPIRQAKVPK